MRCKMRDIPDMFFRSILGICAVMAWLAILSTTGQAEEVISPTEVTDCYVAVGGTVSKLYPGLVTRKIHTPKIHAQGREKEEFGNPVPLIRYQGKLDISVVGRTGYQVYYCTFRKLWGDTVWTFDHAGLGGRFLDDIESLPTQ